MVPEISAGGGRFAQQPKQVPVTLVRSDGVIYPTAMTFTYAPEVMKRPSLPVLEKIIRGN